MKLVLGVGVLRFGVGVWALGVGVWELAARASAPLSCPGRPAARRASGADTRPAASAMNGAAARHERRKRLTAFQT